MAQDKNFNSVSTDEADATGETFIAAERGATSATQNSTAWFNAVDTEVTDNLNEMNSSQQIVPGKSQTVIVLANIQITGADQDRVELRVQDVSSGTDVTSGQRPQTRLNTSKDTLFVATAAELNAGNTHEVQARNVDSSYEIDNGNTSYDLYKAVVHS